ncbi:MAG: hypothetical protein LBS68_02755 [Puniceicoccales bacterium]|nr:hypothetical protein [Puniceicoccales bacterium]
MIAVDVTGKGNFHEFTIENPNFPGEKDDLRLNFQLSKNDSESLQTVLSGRKMGTLKNLAKRISHRITRSSRRSAAQQRRDSFQCKFSSSCAVKRAENELLWHTQSMGCPNFGSEQIFADGTKIQSLQDCVRGGSAPITHYSRDEAMHFAEVGLKDDSNAINSRKWVSQIPNDFFSRAEEAAASDGTGGEVDYAATLFRCVPDIVSHPIIKDVTRGTPGVIADFNGNNIELVPNGVSAVTDRGDVRQIISTESVSLNVILRAFREAYPNDEARSMLALIHFLAGPFSQQCAAAVQSGCFTATQNSSINSAFCGDVKTFSRVTLSRDATIKWESIVVKYNADDEHREAEEIPEHNLVCATLQYTVGKPFNEQNPSSVPEEWNSLQRNPDGSLQDVPGLSFRIEDASLMARF